MLGERFSAMRAKQLGLVNGVYPQDELMKRARGAAEKLAKSPPEALRLTKALLRRDEDAIRAALLAEGEAFVARMTSAEAMEAFSAFMERRAPDFSKFE